MKIRRHGKILELISKYPIDTQEELLNKLKKEGYNVTQATVSRDIKELRLLKTLVDDGSYRYTIGSKDITDLKPNFDRLFSRSVSSVDYSENMIVIKTLAGMAQAVCAAFDSMEFDTVVGTLAGEDTIFIVMRTKDLAIDMVSELKKYL